ncbi:MAG: hypothetical protein R2849_19695 [Thermomicrobiales bacterium]
MTQPADAQIHPDGDRVAYTRSSAVGKKGDHAGTSEIWFTAGVTDDRRLTAEGTHARHRWSPDGKQPAFLES